MLVTDEQIKSEIVRFVKANYKRKFLKIDGWVRQQKIVSHIMNRYKVSEKKVRDCLNDLTHGVFPVLRTRYYAGGRYYAPVAIPLQLHILMEGTLIIVVVMTLLKKIILENQILIVLSPIVVLWAVCAIWIVHKKMYES